MVLLFNCNIFLNQCLLIWKYIMKKKAKYLVVCLLNPLPTIYNIYKKENFRSPWNREGQLLEYMGVHKLLKRKLVQGGLHKNNGGGVKKGKFTFTAKKGNQQQVYLTAMWIRIPDIRLAGYSANYTIKICMYNVFSFSFQQNLPTFLVAISLLFTTYWKGSEKVRIISSTVICFIMMNTMQPVSRTSGYQKYKIVSWIIALNIDISLGQDNEISESYSVF